MIDGADEEKGVLFLRGDINHANVMSVFEESLKRLKNKKEWQIDFSKLSSSNSAGLALILEWVKYGINNGIAVTFKNIPNDIILIAKVAGLDKLLKYYSASVISFTEGSFNML